MFTAPVTHLRLSDPRSISGCKCWLRSDLGITLATGKVSTWASQVGSVSGNATQSTGAAQPAWSTGGLNGRPRLSFTGTEGLQWALDLQGTMTTLIVAIDSPNPTSGTSHIVTSVKGSTGPVRSELYFVNAASYTNVTFKNDLSALAAGVGYSPTLNTSGHIVLLTYNGGTNTSTGSYTSSYDGVSQTIVASSSVGGRASTDLGSIGAFITSGNVLSNFFKGEIYEIAVYNRVLTTDEQTQLYKYAKALYGL